MIGSDVYCLEQTEADVPANDSWLSAGETVHLADFCVPKRRADWRLGRWTAKCAVAAYLHLPVTHAGLAEIEILARPSGAPQASIACRPAPVEISLSHRAGIALCVVASPGTAIGCDLELAEAHSDAFVRDYFTDHERAEIARVPAEGRALFISALWSAKESALKALQEGLRLDTRSVSVSLDHRSTSDQWYTLQVDYTQGELLKGWWHHTGDRVCTIVAKPRPAMPKILRFPARLAS